MAGVLAAQDSADTYAEKRRVVGEAVVQAGARAELFRTDTLIPAGRAGPGGAGAGAAVDVGPIGLGQGLHPEDRAELAQQTARQEACLDEIDSAVGALRAMGLVSCCLEVMVCLRMEYDPIEQASGTLDQRCSMGSIAGVGEWGLELHPASSDLPAAGSPLLLVGMPCPCPRALRLAHLPAAAMRLPSQAMGAELEEQLPKVQALQERTEDTGTALREVAGSAAKMAGRAPRRQAEGGWQQEQSAAVAATARALQASAPVARRYYGVR